MKLRTQLVLAFLLLAVVPLSGIVLYSYYSSLKAVRQAAEKEAWALAEEMDGRMASIRRELGQGVERIGDVSAQDLLAAARSHQAGAPNPILDRMVRGFGEAAPLVRSLEFIPAAPDLAARAVPSQIPATVVVDVSKALEEARRRLEKIPGANPEALREITREQARLKAASAQADRAAMVHPVELPVKDRGAVVCTIKAQVRGDEVLRRVLARTRSGSGEVPFALDARGNLHTVDAKDREQIAKLPLSRRVLDDWVVATSKDPESGVTFGIARQVPLGEVRRTAARNFGYGLGMIGLALLGILPLSARITHDLRRVTAGAERIAHGDLDARVPVRSRNEVGQLALTFNRMAEDLKAHQERLLEEERLRREREVDQARLRTEYDRKSQELEEARRFQLSLLPKSLPEHPGFEIAVSMRTATEVGGDYYDFHLGEDGSLTAAVGDATGHGARAGTMVTAVKSLFSAFAGRLGPRELLDEAARAVRRMELGRMAMGLCVARLDGQGITLSSAGMPPVLVHRRETGRAEEIALQGMPLGGFAASYQELRLELAPGDTVLMMTDGLPELANAEGEPLGYPSVRALFESLGQGSPEEVIAGLARGAESWTGGLPIKDDVTLVAIRRTV
jgi:serine phosphatase RsbU (regulator of sigma subunit)